MPICFLSPPFHTDLLLIWEQMHIVEGTEIKIISTVSITLTPLNNSHLLVFLSYFRATEIQSFCLDISFLKKFCSGYIWLMVLLPFYLTKRKNAEMEN